MSAVTDISLGTGYATASTTSPNDWKVNTVSANLVSWRQINATYAQNYVLTLGRKAATAKSKVRRVSVKMVVPCVREINGVNTVVFSLQLNSELIIPVDATSGEIEGTMAAYTNALLSTTFKDAYKDEFPF